MSERQKLQSAYNKVEDSWNQVRNAFPFLADAKLMDTDPARQATIQGIIDDLELVKDQLPPFQTRIQAVIDSLP